MSATMAFASRSPGLVLFAEDFDTAANSRKVHEPEIIEPSFTRADLEAARQQGWKAGHDAAAAAANQAAGTAVREAIAGIAARLADARDQAEAVAQQTASELARLLLECLGAALPALAARHGESELRSLVRTLLPALNQEPNVTVRLHPDCADAVRQDIAQADPELAARLQVVALETMTPGDIRIAWRSGQATRDIAALWGRVTEILAPSGLLPGAGTKEIAHGE